MTKESTKELTVSSSILDTSAVEMIEVEAEAIGERQGTVVGRAFGRELKRRFAKARKQVETQPRRSA